MLKGFFFFIFKCGMVLIVLITVLALILPCFNIKVLFILCYLCSMVKFCLASKSEGFCVLIKIQFMGCGILEEFHRVSRWLVCTYIGNKIFVLGM